jgi:hypothetical protein
VKGTTEDKTTITTNAATAAMLDGSDRDAYEAAQNILKAINFGDLLRIAQNEDGGDDDNKKSTSFLSGGGDGGGGGEVSMDQLTSLLIQAQHAMSSQQQSMEGQQQQQAVNGVGMNSSLGSVTPLPTLSATAGIAVASTSTLTSNGAGPSASMVGVNVRAELQAQLALLAVQLAELRHESEGGAANGTVAQLLQHGQNGIVAEPRCEDVGRREEQGMGGGGSMAVLDSEGPSLPPPPAPPRPPMNGLLPLSLNPDMNSSSDVSGSVWASLESTQSRPLHRRREDGNGDGDDDIPIDPVLRDVGAVPGVGSLTCSVTPPITTTTTATPTTTTTTTTTKTPAPTMMMATTDTTPLLSVTEELEQSLPPVVEKITGSGPTVSDVTMTTAVSVSVPSVDRGREEEEEEEEEGRRLGNAIPSSVMMGGGGGGGDDDDGDSDDDMEEII